MPESSDAVYSQNIPSPPFDAPVEQRDAYWREHVYRADKEPQLTWRAVVFGGIIGVLACASGMYTSLKIGWGFGVAISACIVSYVFFNGLRNLSGGRIKAMGLLENGATASVASVTGITPSHTVVGAFGGLMLLGTGVSTDAWEKSGLVPWYYMVPTVFFSALLGTLIAIPLKRNLINIEQLKFPSSIALAETMHNLYAHGKEAAEKARCLLGGIAVGGVLGMWKSLGELSAALRDVFGLEWFDKIATDIALPALVPFGGALNPLNWWQINGRPALFGLDLSLLLVGAGMIVGLRVSITMLATALLLNCLVLPLLVQGDLANANAPTEWTLALANAQHLSVGTELSNIYASAGIPAWNASVEFVPTSAGPVYKIYAWSLWCGTAIMVMSGLTALAFQWPILVRAFSGIFSKKKTDAGNAYVNADVEVPMKWFAIGIVPVGLGLIVTLWLAFGIAPYLGLIAVLLSFVTGLICARTCGEVDVNPIGAMGKVAQLFYSVLPGAKGHADVNLLSGGVTATAGGACGDLSSDMKVGYLLGSNPRKQFWAQIIGVCIGTVIVVPIWCLLVPDKAKLLSYNPPAATMWKAVAEFLTSASTNLPETAKWSLGVGACLGVILPVLENFLPKYRAYLPSAMGVGLALVLPSNIPNSLSFVIGAVIMRLWARANAKHNDKYGVALASGFVAGESLAMAGIAIAATIIYNWPTIAAAAGL